jgi:protein-disulfide isomerase
VTHLNSNQNNLSSGERGQEPTAKSKNNRWIWFLLTLVVISAVILVSLRSNGGPEDIHTDSLRAIGPDTAPVTITEYADFGCITCKAWHQFGIREQILEYYGDQVRFVWRDFPITTPQSPRAAEAGLCAHDQGYFWEYHTILFANAPAFDEQALRAYAAEIGLDTQRFADCLEAGEHQEAVERERLSALELGLRSVPSFMVNDQRLIGPPSFEQLVSIIEEILASGS